VRGRTAEVSLQELTGDFKQMHIKLHFQAASIIGFEAKSQFVGHSLTSDYIRRMTRRNHSKIGLVMDFTTKDGGVVRVKPFAITDRRVQSSQEKALRESMEKVLTAEAAQMPFSEFVREVVDGKMAGKMYKVAKPIYPVRRIEIYKSEVKVQPIVTATAQAQEVAVATGAGGATVLEAAPAPARAEEELTEEERLEASADASARREKRGDVQAEPTEEERVE
jgi:small subunit ribosomal protein S3Ae